MFSATQAHITIAHVQPVRSGMPNSISALDFIANVHHTRTIMLCLLCLQACVGQNKCSISVTNDVFGDPCQKVVKDLAVEAECSPPLAAKEPRDDMWSGYCSLALRTVVAGSVSTALAEHFCVVVCDLFFCTHVCKDNHLLGGLKRKKGKNKVASFFYGLLEYFCLVIYLQETIW